MQWEGTVDVAVPETEIVALGKHPLPKTLRSRLSLCNTSPMAVSLDAIEIDFGTRNMLDGSNITREGFR
jgi:hypothetical protein